MGAINFIAGTWCGGGSGKLFEFDSPEDFDDVEEVEAEYNYQSEVYNNAIKLVDRVNDELIAATANDFVKIEYNDEYKLYRLERILRRLCENNGCKVVKVAAGYYSGFQIIADRDALEKSWRNYNGYNERDFLATDEVDEIEEIINARLSELEFNYIYEL